MSDVVLLGYIFITFFLVGVLDSQDRETWIAPLWPVILAAFVMCIPFIPILAAGRWFGRRFLS